MRLERCIGITVKAESQKRLSQFVIICFALIIIVVGMDIKNADAFDYVFGKTDLGTARSDYEPDGGQPTLGESYTDPNFNTTVQRVTDISKIAGATHIQLHYGHRSPSSINNRYLVVFVSGETGSVNPYWIWDMQSQTAKPAPHISTGGVYAGNCGTDNQPDYIWSRDPDEENYIYYRYGSILYRADVTYPDGEQHNEAYNIKLRDFSEDFAGLCAVGLSQKGTIYYDSAAKHHVFGFTGWDSEAQTIAIFTYNANSDTIIGSLINDDGLPRATSTPKWSGMTPNGRFIWSNWWIGGVPSHSGVVTFPMDFAGGIDGGVRVAGEGRHNGGCWGTDGNWYFFQINDNGVGTCAGDDLCFKDVNNNDSFSVFNQSEFGWNSHHMLWHTGIGSDEAGWVGVEWYDTSLNDWSDNQLHYIEAKEENARIWRVAHFQVADKDMTGSAQGISASVSLDGSRVFFNSTWWETDNCEIYEVQLPQVWWNDLNDGTPGQGQDPDPGGDEPSDSNSESSGGCFLGATGK